MKYRWAQVTVSDTATLRGQRQMHKVNAMTDEGWEVWTTHPVGDAEHLAIVYVMLLASEDGDEDE